jgi:glutamate-1-semialdehyde 2,1-aminomutase
MLADSQRVADLTEQQQALFESRTINSFDLAREAVEVMPLGAPSNVCALYPYPVAIKRASGAYVTDVDDNRYVDYHNGFGTTVMGHANPFVTDAIMTQASVGVHYGTSTEQVVRWAQTLTARFGLDWVRFNNSGTEAVMDALRLCRAYTGRDTIVRVEGAYHGSSPDMLYSGNLAFDGNEGMDSAPLTRPWGKGLHNGYAQYVRVIPFNNIEAATRALTPSDVACVIVEPIMFNVGAIYPQPDYLEALKGLCEQHGTLLVYDETKTCVTVAYGGAEELTGVQPHVKTLGKGIGGGLPVGAFGGTDDRLYDLIESHEVPQLGTFSGNPLTAVAGEAGLCQVLSLTVYRDLEAQNQLLKAALQETISRYELPAYVVGSAAKGCVVWVNDDNPSQEFRNFRDYKRRFDNSMSWLCWLWMMNHGVFLTPGGDEQWTVSVSHGDTETALFADAFEQLAAALRA